MDCLGCGVRVRSRPTPLPSYVSLPPGLTPALAVLPYLLPLAQKEWPAVGDPLPDHLDHALHAGVQSITKQSYPSVSDSTVELVVQKFMAAVGVQTRSVLVTVGNYVRDMPEGDRNVLMNRARGDVLIRAVAYAVGPDSPDHYQPGQLAQQAAALREAQAGIFSNSPPSKEEAYYHTPFLGEYPAIRSCTPCVLSNHELTPHRLSTRSGVLGR